MSRSLGSPFVTLQVCERQAVQRCAPQSRPRRRHDDFPTRRYQPSQSRPFSSSQPWRASQMGKAIAPSMRKQSQPSLASSRQQQLQQAFRSGNIPDEMGLLPQTFVMPRGKNRPSWFSNFGDRKQMEWTRLKTRMTELGALFIYRFWSVRPRPRLQLLTIPGVARDLHKRMYEHFAAGNLTPMENQICDGMLGSLRSRIAQRNPNTGLKWTLHKYLSRPKIASYRTALFPEQKGEKNTERNGVIQAVVRIHSLQSLQHIKRMSTRDANQKLVVREVSVDSQGRESEPLKEGAVPANAKDAVEYVVVQKMIRKGKEGRWMIWGTTEETTMSQIKQDQNKSQQDLLGKNAA
ncbi:hypothetical protein KC315_g1390 [Hortaea werneckii]|uniref:Tim44-like domain-containing protein n=1 Tax=Hortaea werneckii TaxID=91943 RepID=A0A3M7BUX9_HORWE|nr:hypothetical protein KC315_g1390 [Hortaea werneckii]KAI7536722.1 hypothetical protein KC331_g11313 [Hortaea werneckii]KAI7716993.1 hypothetical protein KC353_g4940 [Hortaea werneckii]RMY43310.1 hypothetical protein D0865_11342 [Hortaea werneckii]